MKLTAIFKKVPEGYIGFTEELPGANTQAATLREARANLREAVALVMEANRAIAPGSCHHPERSEFLTARSLRSNLLDLKRNRPAGAGCKRNRRHGMP